MRPETPTLPQGYRVQRYDAITSTNDEAKRLAREGAPGGTVVWAGEQTAGRGRRGRPWLSPRGNLYMSLILRPQAAPAQAAQLGFVAALALVDALDRFVPRGIELRLKWPNDVLANGRKLAGILLESETGGGGETEGQARGSVAPAKAGMTEANAACLSSVVQFLVIGVGVNLAASPSGVEFPATSLAEEGIEGIAPGAVLSGFVEAFERWRRRWDDEGFAPVRPAWLARAAGLGDQVCVRLESSTIDGRFVDLDADGALLLAAPGGPHRIAAGEIFPIAA